MKWLSIRAVCKVKSTQSVQLTCRIMPDVGDKKARWVGNRQCLLDLFIWVCVVQWLGSYFNLFEQWYEASIQIVRTFGCVLCASSITFPYEQKVIGESWAQGQTEAKILWQLVIWEVCIEVKGFDLLLLPTCSGPSVELPNDLHFYVFPEHVKIC